MVSCHYSPMSMALTFFILFSLNTWIFLQHSADNAAEDVRGQRSRRRKKMTLTLAEDGHPDERYRGADDSDMFVRLFKRSHKSVLAPDGARQPDVITERALIECRNLLSKRDHTEKQGNVRHMALTVRIRSNQ